MKASIIAFDDKRQNKGHNKCLIICYNIYDGACDNTCYNIWENKCNNSNDDTCHYMYNIYVMFVCFKF